MIKVRQKFSKLYFPGLISLILLPIFCIFYFWTGGSFQRKGIMEVIWENTQSFQSLNKHAGSNIDLDTYRNYQYFSFDANVTRNATERNLFEKSINKLSANKDFINGVCVKINKHTKYSDIVYVLDNARSINDSTMSVVPYNDEILILKIKPYKPANNLAIDSRILYNDIVYIKPKVTFWNKLNDAVSRSIDYFRLLIQFWPCLIILLVMGWLSLSGKNKLYIHRKENVFD